MANIYVDRDGSQNIIGVFAREQTSGQESILDTDQEYLDFVEPEKNILSKFLDILVRPERDTRLHNSDKYKIDDYPLGSVTMTQIDTYRQDLRDFPSTITSIPTNSLDDLVWPIDPTI